MLTACTGKQTESTGNRTDESNQLSSDTPIASEEENSSFISMSNTDDSEEFFKFIVGDGSGRVGFRNAVNTVSGSAVALTVTGMGGMFSSYTTEVYGSGVIISEDGYILTANHVIDGGKTVTVTTVDGSKYDATVIGADKKTDVAVIKIEANGLSPAKLSSSETLAAGDFVFTVGNAFGQNGNSAVFGFIGDVNREVSYDGETRNMIQLDGNINKGNSGGGLFDSNGELIGIVSALQTSADLNGVGFALPSSAIMTAVEDLINHGYVRGRPCVGFTAVEINDIATATINGLTRLGLYIKTVEESTSASECGLQFKDYIQAVDGETVTTLERLNEIIKSKNIGDSIILEIIRSDSTIDMVLVIEEEHK